jgi:phosphate transport system protein
MRKQRVLFLCTGNSARSQMAEGLVNHYLGEQWEAYSAGTRPAWQVHPLAVEAMAELGGSKHYITFDRGVRKRRFCLEMACVAFIVGQRPQDGDLRTVTAILEIVTELEHMGGYIADIAETQLLIAQVDETFSDLVADIHRLAGMVQDMLHRAIEGFGQGDLDLVRRAHADDDAIDALYASVHREVLSYMVGTSHRLAKQARYLAQIARDLERTADRVTNICEWVVFSETGRLGKAAIPGRGGSDNAMRI